MIREKTICFLIAVCVILAACSSGLPFGTSEPTATWITFPTANQVSPTREPTNTKAASSSSSLSNVGPVSPVMGLPSGTDGYPWWDDSVIYEIYVRSFYDSNGDGIGDLKGITQKLDYLNDGDSVTNDDLGITCIWLMPIFPSPTVHGYHVTDYYDVDPLFGGLEDLQELIREAHGRGIRLILDIPFNHTSVEHPWFVASQDPSSPYRDWYIWKDSNPGYSGYWGQEVWHELNGEYYYGNISKWGPDLNLLNPEVVDEIENITRFWLEEVGVDGFRLDSAKHLIEEGTLQGNTASTHIFWKQYRTFYKGINPDALMLPEIWENSDVTAAYVMGDELDVGMDFYLAELIIQSLEEENTAKLISQIKFSYSQMSDLQLGVFLTNHDQHRTMTRLGNEPEKAKAAASILFSAPGVPIMYYGEVIGMEGYVDGDENRLPMQWSNGTFAGFSTTAPWKGLGREWKDYNVALETNDPTSLLTHYRNLILTRSQHEALRIGDFQVVETGNNGLYCILRVSDQEAILVLVNLTGMVITDYLLTLDQSQLGADRYTPNLILGEGDFASLNVDDQGGFAGYTPTPEIPAYGTLILQLVTE